MSERERPNLEDPEFWRRLWESHRAELMPAMAEQLVRAVCRPTLLGFISESAPIPPGWHPPSPIDDPAPWLRRFERNAERLRELHGSIEEAALADALECDWPEIDEEPV